MSILQKRLVSSPKWSLSERLRSWVLAFTFPIAFILGTYGYSHYPFGMETVSITNAMYHSVQLFLLHAPHFISPVPWSLEIARWLAAASTMLVLLNAALHLLYNERMARSLKRKKNHTIVCGLGRRGMAVIEKLYSSGLNIVAIDKSPEQDIQERLQHLGIPLIIGDASRNEILVEARVDHASKIYAFCSEDTLNFSIALEANKIKSKTGIPCKCIIHINDAELRNALQLNYQRNSNHTDQNLHFIDGYAHEAISLLAYKLPLDHDGISPTDKRQVHLIILGFGCMGRTIAVKAAQLGQFANRKKLRISVIDRKAEINQASLLFHHPYICDVADFSFNKQEIFSSETRAQIEKWCSEPDSAISVVLCMDNPSVIYDALLNLSPCFDRKNVRVAIRVNESENFGLLLQDAIKKTHQNLNLHLFGSEKGFENLIDPDKNEIEKFAIDIHNAYVNLVKEELKNNPDKLDERNKKGELYEWDKLKEDFRESNQQQAFHIYFKLRTCGYEVVDIEDTRVAIEEFDKEKLEALAIMEHDRWLAERKVNNWKYGVHSDKDNRISSNLVEWDQLTDGIKLFDYDAVKRIPQLLGSIGKKMVKKST